MKEYIVPLEMSCKPNILVDLIVATALANFYPQYTISSH